MRMMNLKSRCKPKPFPSALNLILRDVAADRGHALLLLLLVWKKTEQNRLKIYLKVVCTKIVISPTAAPIHHLPKGG